MARKTDIPAKVRRLRDFVGREKRMPGYNEMLELFEYRSKQAVHSLLLKLVDMGYISKNGRKIAYTSKLIGDIRLLGTVQAGFPSPAEEELLDTITLDEFLIEKPESTYMLRVTGDSMIDAGIHPGDMVLVEKDARPGKNSIVIAQVDGEWTIKYFNRDRLGIRLDPANSKYSSIRPKDSLEIAGVVRSVIRKY
ncbi:MAG: translesion error-prone DNA polymerase V autoproteolytic subunit [Lentisphaerae bacterium]|nr:translesion error-prone DNA polymerase V autoproteolytic subunit [Lentisphaerota bacterium]